MTSKEKNEMRCEFTQCQAMVEERLNERFSALSSTKKQSIEITTQTEPDLPDSESELFPVDKMSHDMLLEAMGYSLFAGGKRIRAVICMKFCMAVGGAPEAALDAACAIEMLHTYTLIHDDMPCMDNDDVRRGKPSNHIEYGEDIAMLAGDALQAAAFETLLQSDLPPSAIVEMARVLAAAAGPNGICGGQYLDLLSIGRQLTMDELLKINSMKTAALIVASARIGVIAGNGSQEQMVAAIQYALALGLAFQIRDDVLDYTATIEELGKPIGSDKENKKTTFASLLDVYACEVIISEMTRKAIKALDEKFDDKGFFKWLANLLAERKS